MKAKPTLSTLLVVMGLAQIGSSDAQPRPHRGVDPDLLAKRDDHTKVVNGCGPGNMQVAGEHKRFANKHLYSVEVDRGDYVKYEVDFLDACNLHDAGYAGATGVLTQDGQWVPVLVYDKILDIDIDYSNKSRKWVDDHFYQDMFALCEQQLRGKDARGLDLAMDACKHRGQPPQVGGPWGAETLYRLVREYGKPAFDDLNGTRENDNPLADQPGQRGVYRDDW